MYLGIDLGTSGAEAPAARRPAPRPSPALDAAADACSARSRCGANSTRPTGGQRWNRRAAAAARADTRRAGSGARHRPVGPDARRGAAGRAATTCCARPSCGTTAAAAPQCAALERRVPQLHADHRQPGHARLHRAQAAVGARARAGRVRRDVRKCCCPRTGCACSSPASCVSDMSDAVGTLWLDVGQRRWSEPMLAACGLSASHMPRLVEGSAAQRHCCAPALAQALGLARRA